jgi:hypothetical protein
VRPRPNHPRNKGLRWNRSTPGELVGPGRDVDIRDEVAYALAELAGRVQRGKKVPLATRTVEALRIACAAGRRAAPAPRKQQDNEAARTRRSNAVEVPGARLPGAPGLRGIRADENAGDSQVVDPTGCRTQCGSQMR